MSDLPMGIGTAPTAHFSKPEDGVVWVTIGGRQFGLRVADLPRIAQGDCEVSICIRGGKAIRHAH